jgi:hypothetical protein
LAAEVTPLKGIFDNASCNSRAISTGTNQATLSSNGFNTDDGATGETAGAVTQVEFWLDCGCDIGRGDLLLLFRFVSALRL